MIGIEIIKGLCLALVFALGVGTMPATTEASPGNAFVVRVVNHAEGEVCDWQAEYYLGGTSTGTQGGTRADGRPLAWGDTFDFCIEPRDLDYAEDLADFRLEMEVRNSAGEVYHCLPDIQLDPAWGEVYTYTLTGRGDAGTHSYALEAGDGRQGRS